MSAVLPPIGVAGAGDRAPRPWLHDAAVPQAHAAEPLRLADPAHLWWVEEGAADIFAVPARAGEPAGAREHLYRAGAGRIFFGIDAAVTGPGWVLLAVPAPGAKVGRLTWQALAALARDPQAADAVGEAVTQWVAALTAGARRGPQPRHYLPLRAGESPALAEGDVCFPVEPLVFVRVEEGRTAFLSQADPAIDAAWPLLPLRDEAWLQATQPARLRVYDRQAALAEPDLWDGLHRYHGLIVAAALRRFEQAARDESLRMQVKARHAQEQLARGLEAFAGTLQRQAATGFAELAADPLLASCQLIGRRMAIPFVAPPRGGVEHGDPVEEIANAARVRFRQVALRGDWWRRDGGHLLGKRQDSKQPVALLWNGRGYELHDPVARTVVPLDEALAASLVPFAHVFFPALPPRALALSDLARFALRTMGGDLRWLLGLGALVGLLALLTPIVTAHVFDALVPASDRRGLVQVTGGLLAVALATGLFSLARGLAALRLESRLDASLQAALWDRLLNLPVPFFKRYSAGDLAQRVNAVNTIRQALSGTTVTTLLTSWFSLVSLGLLLYYDLRLGAVALVLVAGAFVLGFGLGLLKLRYERQVATAAGDIAGLVLEYLRGVTKLRVTGSEARAFANWASAFARMRRLAFSAGHVGNVNEVFLSLYQVLVDVVLFAMAAWLLKEAATAAALTPGAGRTPMTTGQFVAFLAAFAQVMGAVTGLSTTLISVLNLVPLYERARPVLDAEPEADEGRVHPGELQGHIDVVNLTFRYAGGPPVLDNVSFSVRPGGFVAVVGPSGSGKSTLLRCLLGFEQPESGGVFYDNQNLADLDARAVRRQFGVVLQHSQVMPGDIFSNIIGTARLGIDDAWAAARFCGIEDDIRAMPMGMHTVISEGGSTLSGGQRQRILIARAIVQRPRILLFDEATSALDNRTQAVVTRSLNELRATRIVIAHRLTTVMNADQILVMDQGRIVQSGRYQELMAQPGLFRDLAARQIA